jgi:hypothetical protein
MSIQQQSVAKRDGAYESLVNGIQARSPAQLVAESLLQLLNGPFARHAITRLQLHHQVAALGPPPGRTVEEQIEKQGGVIFFLISGWSWIPFELLVSRALNEVVAAMTVSALGTVESYLGKGNFLANAISVSVANMLVLAPMYPFSNLKVKSQLGHTINYGTALDNLWRGFGLLAVGCVVSRGVYFGSMELIKGTGASQSTAHALSVLATGLATQPIDLIKANVIARDSR